MLTLTFSSSATVVYELRCTTAIYDITLQHASLTDDCFFDHVTSLKVGGEIKRPCAWTVYSVTAVLTNYELYNAVCELFV